MCVKYSRRNYSRSRTNDFREHERFYLVASFINFINLTSDTYNLIFSHDHIFSVKQCYFFNYLQLPFFPLFSSTFIINLKTLFCSYYWFLFCDGQNFCFLLGQVAEAIQESLEEIKARQDDIQKMKSDLGLAGDTDADAALRYFPS